MNVNEKINKLGFAESKNLCSSKYTIGEVKGQTKGWEDIWNTCIYYRTFIHSTLTTSAKQ